MQARVGEAEGCEQSGLLIIGHGTSSNLGRLEFHETVDRVKALMPSVIVASGFLEGGDPTIESAWDEIVACGVKKVVVAPLLLFTAGHARNDIPSILRRLAARSSQIQFCQMPPLGCDSTLVELSVSRYRKALESAPACGSATRARTRLLFVARGASDPRARDEALRYSKMVADSANPDEQLTCFLAMAKPKFDEVVAATASSSFERVVVVPHLLFAGNLLERVHDKVAEQEESGSRQQWFLADHLGPDPVVAGTIARRFTEALAPRRASP